MKNRCYGESRFTRVKIDDAAKRKNKRAGRSVPAFYFILLSKPEVAKYRRNSRRRLNSHKFSIARARLKKKEE